MKFTCPRLQVLAVLDSDTSPSVWTIAGILQPWATVQRRPCERTSLGLATWVPHVIFRWRRKVRTGEILLMGWYLARNQFSLRQGLPTCQLAGFLARITLRFLKQQEVNGHLFAFFLFFFKSVALYFHFQPRRVWHTQIHPHCFPILDPGVVPWSRGWNLDLRSWVNDIERTNERLHDLGEGPWVDFANENWCWCRVCEKNQQKGGVVIQTWLPFFWYWGISIWLKKTFRHKKKHLFPVGFRGTYSVNRNSSMRDIPHLKLSKGKHRFPSILHELFWIWGVYDK